MASSVSKPLRSGVLGIYRQVLRYIAAIPGGTSGEFMQQARSKFRQHRTETDPARIQEMLKQVESKLSFLKMQAARRNLPPWMRKSSTENASGRTIMSVDTDGNLVEGSAAQREMSSRFGMCIYTFGLCLCGTVSFLS
jgi:Complex 1 protein (LYR family)